MTDFSADRNPVEQLAEEFVARQRRGEHPDLDEYTARYPQWADEIRELFPALAMMEELKPGMADVTGAYDRVPEDAPGKRLERLGDFRILREVGRGGMGIVYEAEQESLARHVALKVLPAHALLDPRHLHRFRREAKAAARLHHTNIVPVYGVGETDGLHYYVMQFIQGLGLDEVLAELKHHRELKKPSLDDQPTLTGAARGVSAAQVAQSLLTGQFAMPAQAARESGDGLPLSDSDQRGDQPQESGDNGQKTEVKGAAVGAQPPPAPPLPPSPSGIRSPIKEGASIAAQSVHLPGQPENSTLSESGRHYFVSVARVGLQVADALAYAHAQGTLHRDIKPSNLLLDTQGTVWLTDFGLAKATTDQDNLTQAGDLVGTLRYMAPERFLGRSDARGDIYSLGLTLYELLAMRCPFEEPDRMGLIHQVTHDEPTALCKLNAQVPRDLETIVMKAIARDPAHRYATAAELADDLRLFVEDKPIQARRVSRLEQLWRWCRRNPAVAGLSAAALVLLVAVAVTATVGYVQTSTALAREARARQGAVSARQAARIAREEKFRAEKGAERARQLSQAAVARETAAKKKEAQARRQYTDYFTQLARTSLDRGLDLCRREGEVGAGLLWMAQSLEVLPAGQDRLEEAIRTNLAGWHRRLSHPTLRQGLWVSGLAFSPDGRTLVTADQSYARLWNAATGEPIGEPMPHWGSYTGYQGNQPNNQVPVFSTDGKTLLTANNQQARLWNVATGKPAADPLPFPRLVNYVVLHPDGKTVATTGWNGNRYEVRIWNVAARTSADPLPVQAGINAIFFSPDGKTLLTRINQEVRLWNVPKGTPVGEPLRLQGYLEYVLFSPNGKTVLTTGNSQAQLWNADTGKPVGEPLKGLPYSSSPPTFSPDSKSFFVLLYDYQKGKYETRRYDTATMAPIGEPLSQNTTNFQLAAFSPNGKILLAVANQQAQLWNASTGKPVGKPLPQPNYTQWSAAFSPDSTIVLTASGQDVRIWNTATGKLVSDPFRHPDTVSGLAFSPDGQTFVTRSQGQRQVAGRSEYRAEVRFWSLAEILGRPLPHAAAVPAVAVTPDGRTILTGCADGAARLWRVRRINRPAQRNPLIHRFAPASREQTDFSPLHKPLQHPAPVYAVAVSPKSRGEGLLLTGCGDPAKKTGHAQLWNLATGTAIGPPLVHQGPVRAVAFSPDGKTFLTGSDDQTARLWYVVPGNRPKTQPAGSPLRHPAAVLAVAFSPDGCTVLTGCQDGAARLWRVGKVRSPSSSNPRPVGKPLGHPGPVTAVAFTSDGRTLLTATSSPEKKTGEVRAWDSAKCQPLGRPFLHPAPVTALACASDGQTFVTACLDGQARLWHLATGASLGPPLAHLGAVHAAALSSDGKAIVTGGEDNAARVWQASAAMGGNPESARLGVQLATGLKLTPDNRVAPLSAIEQEKGRLRLQVLDKSGGGGDRAQLARAYVQLKQWDRAAGEFTRAIRRKPRDGQLRSERARVYVRLGKYKQAIADFTRALELSFRARRPTQESRPEEADLWVARARAFGRAGSWDKAVSDLTRAIRLKPNDPEIWIRRGRVQYQQRKWEAAASDFAQALGLHPLPSAERAKLCAELAALDNAFDRVVKWWPEDSQLWLERARVHLKVDELEGAAVAFTRAAEVQPKNAHLWLERARVHVRLKRWDKAAEDFDRALIITTMPSERSQIYASLAVDDQAFPAVAHLRPDDPQLWIFRAREQARRGRFPQAAGDFDQALKRDPADSAVWMELAQLYVKQKEWDKAAAGFVKALDLLPNKSAVYLQLAAFDRLFNRAAALRPKDPELWLARGRAFLQQGRYDDAGSDFAKALELLEDKPEDRVQVCSQLITYPNTLARVQTLRPKDWMLWHALGNAHSQALQWKLAAADYAKAVELNSGNPTLAHHYACALLYRGDGKGYRRLCEQILERFTETKDPAVAYMVARSCTLAPKAVADPGVPTRLAQRAVASRPKDPSQLYWYVRTLAICHYRAGNYEKAADRLRESLGELHPGRPGFYDWHWLALTHQALGHPGRAGKYLDKFVQMARSQIPPPYPSGVLRTTWLWEERLEFMFMEREGEAVIRPYLRPLTLARGHVQRREWAKAIPEFTRAIALKKDDGQFYLERGRAYANLVRWQKAGSDFAQALKLLPAESLLRRQIYAEMVQRPKAFDVTAKLHPDDTGLWLARGNFYAERGLWQEAAADYEKAFAFQPPDHWHTWYFHACLRALAGDPEGHRLVCDRMRKKVAATSSPDIEHYVARACVLLPRGVADAAEPIQLAENAVAGAPRNQSYLYTLGTAHYRAGQYKRAIRRLHESIDANPQWPAIGLDWFMLAMAHHRLGQKKVAKAWLDKATEWMDKNTQGGLVGYRISILLSWHDWAECQLLRREAESLFKGTAVPENLKLTIARARAYAQLDMPDRAAAEFTRAAKVRPNALLLRTERARFYERQGKWKEALADWAVAIDTSPKDVNLRLERALAAVHIPNWRESAVDLAKAVELKPEEPEYLGYYGPVLLLAGDSAGYRKFCGTVLKRFGHTKNPRAAYLTARSLGLSPNNGIKPAEGLRLASLAVQSSPRTPWCLHALGMAHFRAGEYKQAILRLRESLNADPNWPGRACNWLGLALAHQQLKHAEEAKKWLEKAALWLDKTKLEAASKSFAFLGMHPHDLLSALVLRREAECRIREKP
jgi:WD40 repeat protein/tetratricopeptide (TPR) repeat protein/serine/threonine protein kinase